MSDIVMLALPPISLKPPSACKACLGKTATRNQAEFVSKVILGLTLN
ncbi:hypothetical protein L9W73_13800 [Vibrio aestuarianus]|uniref:Uncharacterized protein n=1 Tax=Vibrio aestuarianus TaxID=28171 RepID=A0A9X4FGK9_9VIBR|nr:MULTISPECIES: hypothetical protein [Vibrio]MDE1236167.1 hypothetical protein [Vibrio aestuarianus]MDE1247044.1 hypothetical protein [Vibrio aestuarianus]MDE1250853.1 hypothetical protein [Vibrio aestuarianus]MDE1264415.1 hypothetical protein [Vibrio aestuarianus]MDE1296343.1 hypothetical protein [Vibrio aestuarianus]